MTTEELKSYLVVEAEYEDESVEAMTKSELLDAYLKYEGIIGYTSDILDIIENLYNVTLKDWEK